MKYLAVIDYAHLDNGIFLNTFAQSISKQENTQSIILHGGSPYTERVIQSGVMRNEAEVRSQKDLNNRLVALFADEGISAVGINGYHRKAIRLENDELKIDELFFNRLPQQSVLILSALVWDEKEGLPVPISLSRLTNFIQEKLNIDKLFVFNKTDDSFKEHDSKKWQNLSDDFKEKHLPEEFEQYNLPIYLTDAYNFQFLSEVKGSVFIE